MNMLCGIWLAVVVSWFVGKLWPAARLWALIGLSLCFILTGISVMIREHRAGKESRLTVVLASISVLFSGVGVALFLGELAGRFSDTARVLIDTWGTMLWIIVASTVTRDKFQDMKLQSDLQKSPKDAAARETTHVI
jgi:hypothetical protein